MVERPLCAAYHAGLERERRRGIQEDFMSGRLPWVAATNAFGMGLDKADVRFVVHWDMPGSLEAFYQEVGRAGRDGLPAMCLLLFSEGDRRLQEFFIEGSNPRRDTIEAVHDSLFELRENPIFRTIAELERMFLDDPRRSRSNPLTIRSSVIVLERAGALQRLDHAENLAEVAPLVPLPWPEDRYPERARVKRAVHAALGRVFARTEGEPATIRLEHWARDLGIPEESLRRALGELAEDWVVRYVPPFRGSAILLPAVREPLQVDWQALERRRARDVERLETLIRFARSRACRRNLILRHFGEEVPPSGCGTCDPCVLRGRAGPARPQAPFVEAAATLVRKALSGVARARGRCGKRLVAQMLQGSRARRVGQMGLDRLSTHGILRELERDQILELLDILAGEGLIESSGGRLPRIWLSQRGVRVMKGEETLAIEALSPFFAGAGTRAYRARQAPTRPRARQVPPGGGA